MGSTVHGFVSSRCIVQCGVVFNTHWQRPAHVDTNTCVEIHAQSRSNASAWLPGFHGASLVSPRGRSLNRSRVCVKKLVAEKGYSEMIRQQRDRRFAVEER